MEICVVERFEKVPAHGRAPWVICFDVEAHAAPVVRGVPQRLLRDVAGPYVLKRGAHHMN